MVRRILRILGRVLGALACIALGPLATLVSGEATWSGDWRTASRERHRLAPEPRDHRPAIVQVYGARAFRWRGAFGVHTWVATKASGASTYITYEVLGWHARYGGNTISVSRGYPDRAWYGAPPTLLADVRGPRASAMIPRIASLAHDYPYAHQYRIWPGPNSNTFIAYLTRALPELRANLPPNAIGKDFLVSADGSVEALAKAPSGHGIQLSAAGLAGVIVSPVEGLEVNFLGLGFGIDPAPWTLRLPGLGQLTLPGIGTDSTEDTGRELGL